jgi:hypothetical protein
MKLNLDYKNACYSVEDYYGKDAARIRKAKPTEPVHYGTIRGEDGEFIDVWVQYDAGWVGFLHIQGNKKLALRFNNMELLLTMMCSTGLNYDWFPVYKKKKKYYMIAEIDWYKD